MNPVLEDDVRQAAGREVIGVEEETEELTLRLRSGQAPEEDDVLTVEVAAGGALMALCVGAGLLAWAWWLWAEREARRFLAFWGHAW